MREKRWLWGVTVLVAGGLGLSNGVWTYVTEPALKWLMNATVAVISLGVENYKDGIYKDAARGSHERVGTVLLQLAIVAICMFTFREFLDSGVRLIRARRQFEPDAERAAVFRVGDKIFGDPIADSRVWLRRMRVAHYALFAGLFFATGSIVAGSIRTSLANDAVAYYGQLRALVAPHVEHSRLLDYDARFAGVRTRDDYYNLVKELDGVVRLKGPSVPDFYVW